MKIDRDTLIFCSFAKNAGNVGCTIFNRAFEYHSINALYKSFSVDDIGLAVKAARVLNFRGFAITMPFKKRVLEFVDEYSEEVSQIGSSNTVVNDNGILKSYNTDYVAAKEILIENGEKYNQVVILGNGGYAAAVRYAVDCIGMSHQTITRKSWDKIEKIMNSVVYNCTPVEHLKVDESNVYVDSLVSTVMGRRLSLIQAKEQYKLYTGLEFPNMEL